ncbi:MAG: ribonuclease Y [Deltaproteobacteria bacterium]|nr:ribonuclease Y [Deltaproteobacteria bacterium]MBW2309509.1 ribonuclease Y [Deltaproteobacteria bacterium]
MVALYVSIGTLVGIILGGVIGVIVRKKIVERKLDSAEDYSKKVMLEASKQAETIRKEAQLQAKDKLYQMKLEFEEETTSRRKELQNQERRLFQKEEALDKKMEQLEQRESGIANKEANIANQEDELKKKGEEFDVLIEEERRKLERIAGISAADAKEMLISSMELEARHEASKLIKRIEGETREISSRKAQEILALAIKRYAGDYVAEECVSVVNLPNDEMKGRIIGREGRNIRALEAATGIDLIIDDTPEAVVLSGFNPVRREVAKVALERLIEDGRIHPARIEEVVERVGREIEMNIKEAGEQATFDIGLHGIHPELIKMIGRLKYRSSYAQNVLQHSIEVSFLCGIIAAELGLNEKQAKRIGLLHDIGKAVDHEVEGTHALIGAELAKKYGESEEIIHAIAAHHEDIPAGSIMDVILQAADTLSGARPGARREMLESYVKRLDDMEKIANSLKGVSKSYAIQAGRELRIIVESDKVDDSESTMICREVAKKIEKDLTYPGQIKVTVIRETRAIEYAK